jgi:hypothetical protein
MVADHVVLALSWDEAERDWLQSRIQVWTKVANVQPRWQFIGGDQWGKKAARPEDTEARPWLDVRV